MIGRRTVRPLFITGIILWFLVGLLVGDWLITFPVHQKIRSNASFIRLTHVLLKKTSSEEIRSIGTIEQSTLEKYISTEESQKPQQLWLLAKWYLVAQTPQQAIELYESLLQRYPYRQPLVQEQLGRIYYELGDIQQAVGYWSQAGVCGEMNRMAGEAIEAKAWQTASALARGGLTVCPYNKDGIYLEIKALKGLGELTQAVDFITEALMNSRPVLVDLWLAKAQIQAELGDWEISLQSCQSALVIPAIYPEALLCTGRALLYGRLQPEMAIPYLELAITLKPQEVWNYIVLGDAYDRQGNVKKAEQVYLQGAQAVPDSETPHLYLASLYKEQDNLPAAENALLAVLARNPESVRGLVGYGSLLLDESRMEEALVQLQLAVKYDPTNIEGLTLLAQVYQLVGDIKSAVATYERILVVDSRNETARQALEDLLR